MSYEPVLTANQLSYQAHNGRRTTTLVEDINLELHPGEMVGLIGPNGAGKSTLLKLLLGSLTPTTGSVHLAGTPLPSYTARDRAAKIAYLSQANPAGFSFTVVEIVEMGSYPVLGLGRSPGQSERREAMDALRYVGLAHIAERSFPTLSSGEQQLVLFARVLVQNTPVILLDEPTSNLDIGHETQLLQMTRELSEEGRSVLVALHNLNSAAEYCSRLILMNDRTIAAQGSAKDVLTQQLIQDCYRTPVHIGTNDSSGSTTVTPLPTVAHRSQIHVHLIGGAGSAVTLTRRLHLLGCRITGGIAHELDSDARLWQALSIPFVQVPAFAAIDDASLQQAKQLTEHADMTILCGFPFGHGNRRNLELAAAAPNLCILDAPDTRSFYAAGTEHAFSHLTQQSPVLSYEKIISEMQLLLQ